MSREWWTTEGRPFVSVILILVTLFVVVFIKTEVRRLGYEVWRETKTLRKLEDELRLLTMEHASLMSPERLRNQAISRLTLSEAKKGQVIQMLGDGFAVSQ